MTHPDEMASLRAQATPLPEILAADAAKALELINDGDARRVNYRVILGAVYGVWNPLTAQLAAVRAENKALRDLLHTAANSIGGFIEECELLDNQIAKARVVAGKRLLAVLVNHLAQSDAPGAGKEET